MQLEEIREEEKEIRKITEDLKARIETLFVKTPPMTTWELFQLRQAAKVLYLAGYRKADDVRKEVVKEFYYEAWKALDQVMNERNYLGIMYAVIVLETVAERFVGDEGLVIYRIFDEYVPTQPRVVDTVTSNRVDYGKEDRK